MSKIVGAKRRDYQCIKIGTNKFHITQSKGRGKSIL